MRHFVDDVQALCDPGERVVDLATVQYAPGEERLGPREEVVTFDPINGLTVSRWDDGVAAGLQGRTLLGFPGCSAQEFVESLSDADCTLVVTDRRLLVVHGLVEGAARVAHAIPLDDVSQFAHDPFWNQRGRMVLGFVDGSLLRLHAGYLFAGRARRLVDAVHRSVRPRR